MHRRSMQRMIRDGVQRMQDSVQQDRAVLAYLMDDLYQRRRRHPAMRMSMRQRGRFRAEAADVPDIFSPVIEVQADGSHAHHAAAAFAVVDRLLHRPMLPAAQGGKAGISRSPGAVQFRDVAKPGVAGMNILGVFTLLRRQPVLVAKPDVMRIGIPDSTGHASGHPQQEAVCGEQRHLRIIGDLRDPAGQLVFRDTALAVSAEDLSFAKKLDGIPQSVPGGSADQTPSEPVLIPHSGTPSKTVQSLVLLDFQYSIEECINPVWNL